MDLEYLNQNFCLGGYHILKATSRSEWMNSNVLQELVLSASRCICDFYPDIDVVWDKSMNKKEEYRKNLELNNQTYNQMENWINREFENNFDFPDVFNSYESAAEFYHKFLANEKDLKIMAIALPNSCRYDFLEDQDDLRYGICKNINRSLSIGLNGIVLGYEILGFEFGGFHSYICNGLEDEYYNKYKLKLNNNGFISTFEEAQTLAEFTNNEIEGAEPVLWLPWLILEYPL